FAWIDSMPAFRPEKCPAIESSAAFSCSVFDDMASTFLSMRWRTENGQIRFTNDRIGPLLDARRVDGRRGPYAGSEMFSSLPRAISSEISVLRSSTGRKQMIGQPR